MLALLLFIFDILQYATSSMLIEILWLLICTIVIGIISLYIYLWVMSKVMKMNKEMSFDVTITALYSFPQDYIITKEVVDYMNANKEEKSALLNHMLPPMLVGGFITVTVVSVVLAGIFVTYL